MSAVLHFTNPAPCDSNPALDLRPARLALEYLTLDPRLQSRELKPVVVNDYVSVLRRGGDLPPVRVVREGRDKYYLVDGYHRTEATREVNGIDTIPVEIIDGTFTDALWHSWGANRDHGLRRTQKETRGIIRAALQHPKWSKESDRAIAQQIGCDHKTVAAMRRYPAAGEFPTESRPRADAGPSKRAVVQACRVLAGVRPEQGLPFDPTEMIVLRAACESLQRLLGTNSQPAAGQQTETVLREE